MPSRVWAAYEALRAYEPVMRWADVTTLHDLRIAAKWLRYTLEFVREALGRDAGPVIEKVVALQDHLGWLHDADVAAGLARGFLVEHAGDLTEVESAAIGRYLVDRERSLAKLRRTVGTGVAGRVQPRRSGARSGGSSPGSSELEQPCGRAQPGRRRPCSSQPATRNRRRSRHAAPAVAAARTAPSRMPSSETWSRSTP